MKKRIALLLVLVLALSFVLASCAKECKEHTDADIDEVCDVCGAAVPFEPEYLGFEGYYNTTYDNEDKEVALAAAAKLADLGLTDISHPQITGNLALFTNDNAEPDEKKAVILNLDTGAVVYSLDQERYTTTTGENAPPIDKTYTTVSLAMICDGRQTIIVEKEIFKGDFTATYTKTLYTALGVQIAEAVTSKGFENKLTSPVAGMIFNDTVPYSTINGTNFSFNGKIYTLKDDVAAFRRDVGFAPLPSYDVETDTYNYELNYDALYLYDKTDKLVASYNLPVDIEYSDMYVLANGNILIQYSTLLPYNSLEYDYKYMARYAMSEGDNGEAYYIVPDGKYDLTTLVYDVETKTAAEVDFNYSISAFMNKYENEDDFAEIFVADKIDNYVALIPIEDKLIDERNIKFVNLRSSDLKLLGYLAQEVPNQEDLPELIDNNRFVVDDMNGKTYLLNEKGEVLADVSDINFNDPNQVATVNERRLILVGTKIYDTSLNLVFDQADINKYFYSVSTGLMATKSIVVTDPTTVPETTETRTSYYTFYNAEVTKLNLPAKYNNLYAYNNYIAYTQNVDATETESAKTYEVYLNEAGAEIFKVLTTPSSTTNEGVTTTVETDVDVVYSGEAGVIFCVTTTTTVGTEAPTSVYTYYMSK